MQIKAGEYIISDGVLNKKFSPCNFKTCGNNCCQHGALVSLSESKKIKKALPEIMDLMRPEAVKVIKEKGFYIDSKFSRFDLNQSDEYHFTRTVKGKCVFFNYTPEGSCVLQRYCETNNINPSYKPPGCWSFPFDSLGNKIVVVKWKGLPCLDMEKAPPIYESCRWELTDFLGKKGYKKLLQKIGKIKKNSEKGSEDK